MFISWGTKVASKRLGRVADFCPICRDIQAFGVTKLDKIKGVVKFGNGPKKTVRGVRSRLGSCRRRL